LSDHHQEKLKTKDIRVTRSEIILGHLTVAITEIEDIVGAQKGDTEAHQRGGLAVMTGGTTIITTPKIEGLITGIHYNRSVKVMSHKFEMDLSVVKI